MQSSYDAAVACAGNLGTNCNWMKHHNVISGSFEVISCCFEYRHTLQLLGPFLESPSNFSDQELYFKIKI